MDSWLRGYLEHYYSFSKRCFLCTRLRNSIYSLRVAGINVLPEKAASSKCKSCGEDPWLDTIFCKLHLGKALKKIQHRNTLHECIRDALRRPIKEGMLGCDVRNDHAMQVFLSSGQAFEEVKTGTTGDGLDRPTARQVCEMIVREDPRLLIPDCEWGPSRSLYDICISSIDESDMFERKVVPNGCMTVRDIYKYARETYHGNIAIETAAIGKTFGPASDELHGGVTISELHKALRVFFSDRAHFGRPIFIEWALGYGCDQQIVQEQFTGEKLDARGFWPRKEDCFLACDAWRQAMPGLTGHRLGFISLLVRPDSDLPLAWHGAKPDVRMTRQIMFVFARKFLGLEISIIPRPLNFPDRFEIPSRNGFNIKRGKKPKPGSLERSVFKEFHRKNPYWTRYTWRALRDHIYQKYGIKYSRPILIQTFSWTVWTSREDDILLQVLRDLSVERCFYRMADLYILASLRLHVRHDVFRSSDFLRGRVTGDLAAQPKKVVSDSFSTEVKNLQNQIRNDLRQYSRPFSPQRKGGFDRVEQIVLDVLGMERGIALQRLKENLFAAKGEYIRPECTTMSIFMSKGVISYPICPAAAIAVILLLGELFLRHKHVLQHFQEASSLVETVKDDLLEQLSATGVLEHHSLNTILDAFPLITMKFIHAHVNAETPKTKMRTFLGVSSDLNKEDSRRQVQSAIEAVMANKSTLEKFPWSASQIFPSWFWDKVMQYLGDKVSIEDRQKFIGAWYTPAITILKTLKPGDTEDFQSRTLRATIKQVILENQATIIDRMKEAGLKSIPFSFPFGFRPDVAKRLSERGLSKHLIANHFKGLKFNFLAKQYLLELERDGEVKLSAACKDSLEAEQLANGTQVPISVKDEEPQGPRSKRKASEVGKSEEVDTRSLKRNRGWRLAGDGHPNAKGEVKCAACQQLKSFVYVTKQNPQYQGLICLAWQGKRDDCGHGLEVEEKYEYPKSDKRGRWLCRLCWGFFDQLGIHRQPDAHGKPSVTETPCHICGVEVSTHWFSNSILHEGHKIGNHMSNEDTRICSICLDELQRHQTIRIPSKSSWYFDERNHINFYSGSGST
jgi:hypothetical protein